MRLVLTHDDCTYAGDPPVTGTFTIDVENRSSLNAAFAVAEMSRDAALHDLEAYLETERRRFERTGALRGPPPFYSQVVRVTTAPGTSSSLPADVEPGKYVLMCFIDDPPSWQGFLAGEFEISE